MELVYAANEAGIPNEKIWVDGIVTPVNIQQAQCMALLTFQMMLEDIAPGAMSTCGLSNISNGPPVHLRPIINTTYMIMLGRYGMKSVISDPLDTNLTDVAKGRRQDIVDVVYQAMDGEAPDPSSLSKLLPVKLCFQILISKCKILPGSQRASFRQEWGFFLL